MSRKTMDLDKHRSGERHCPDAGEAVNTVSEDRKPRRVEIRMHHHQGECVDCTWGVQEPGRIEDHFLVIVYDVPADVEDKTVAMLVHDNGRACIAVGAVDFNDLSPATVVGRFA